MRILHVVEPFSSGIITFIILLTKSMPEYEHSVFHGVRTTEDKIDSVRARFPDSVSFSIWKHANRSTKLFEDVKALYFLYRYIKHNDFDIVHLHSAKAGFLGRLACWFLRKRAVIYTPNGAPFIRQDIGKINKKIFKLLERFADTLSGQTVTCGKSESEVYSRAGIKNNYINNGIEVDDFSERPIEKPICFGTMSILTDQKDPLTFNEIAAHFIGNENTQFLWVGDGKFRSKMDEDALKITGWLGELEVRKQLDKFDVYLSTALWEGQPFAVLEAMRRCKCLLLRDCVGNRDLVKHGENGFLYKTQKEAIGYIEFLIKNPDEISKMGKMSRAFCEEHHNMINMGKSYEKVYNQLLKR